MKIEIIGRGPITPAQLDEIFFGTSTINKKNPLEEAMDKLLDEVKRGEAKTIILDSLGNVTEEIEKDAVGKYKSKPICFDIQSIIANHKKNAFTVVWGDGSHTIIHLQKGDVWDDEKALAMCFVKHLFGDKSNFNDIFTEELPSKLKEISKKEEPVKTDESKDASAGVKKLEDVCAMAGINLKKASETAEKAENTLTGLLEKFLSSSAPVYDVYTKKNGTNVQIIAAAEKDVISKYLKIYVQKHYPTLVGTPWRIWTVGKEHPEMYIDFGASEYFVIPGMTCEEWNKNN